MAAQACKQSIIESPEEGVRIWALIRVVRVALRICAPIFFCMSPISVQAQQKPWEDYSRHISSSREVAQLSGDLFHESVSLYNGRVSFRHVDIDIPGNSSLPVTLARTFSVKDPSVVAPFTSVLPSANDLPMADWDIDVPRLGGIFAYKLLGPLLGGAGLIANPTGQIHGWVNQRCSGLRVPPAIGEFYPSDYWSGISVDINKGGELLEPTQSMQRPTAGGPYRWVTADYTWVSCLPAIKNGSGEGFLAIAPDGTRYWFDWMAAFVEPMLNKAFEFGFQGPTGDFDTIYDQNLDRRRYMLYATRVEDRFGNWVAYEYENTADQPVRLSRIYSSDNRKITLAYRPDGKVSSASDGSRTWKYYYATQAYRLERVVLPDNSEWGFDLGNVPHEYELSAQHRASCNFPGIIGNAVSNVILKMTHPSGARGEFEMGLRLHGRSNVPRQCINVPAGEGPEAGAYSDYVRFYWAYSLVKKRMFGPGVPLMQWEYEYKNSQKPTETGSLYSVGYTPPGSWHLGPYTVTRISEEGRALTDPSTYRVIDPICVSDSCAGRVATEVLSPGGKWSRYTFGSGYRYNEQKLLKVESGSGPSSISRVENYSYELSTTAQPFPVPLGLSRQYKGDTITAINLRPLRERSIIQDGLIYRHVVTAFDLFGRPVNVKKESVPVQ